MPNASKDKGDRYEREAVVYFQDLWPDLLVWNAARALGAGRKEDVGDLVLFPDAAVQVKAYAEKYLSKALYEAADGATKQAGHARKDIALGMVLVPRARKVGTVRWAASCERWPIEVEHTPFSNSLAALAAVKKAGPDTRFTAVVIRKNTVPIVIGSLQTWVAAYREATGRPAPDAEATQ
jgi:hypothetical protein